MIIKPNQPTQPPANQPETLNLEEIIDATKTMLGGLPPYLSFGVAQHEALLKATLAGANPDHERSIRTATRHVENTDPSNEAVALVHAGMVLVGALKAGVHPADAGVLASETIYTILGLGEEADEPDEPDTDY